MFFKQECPCHILHKLKYSRSNLSLSLPLPPMCLVGSWWLVKKVKQEHFNENVTTFGILGFPLSWSFLLSFNHMCAVSFLSSASDISYDSGYAPVITPFHWLLNTVLLQLFWHQRPFMMTSRSIGSLDLKDFGDLVSSNFFLSISAGTQWVD